MLFFLSLLLSSMLTIGGGLRGALEWQRKTFEWRDAEYKKLSDLRAGYSYDQLRKQLGAPVFERVSDDRKLIEHSFSGRDHWVQTVSDRSENTVLMYSVTSCASSFNPSFEVPTLRSRPDDPPVTPVVWQRSRFSDVKVEDGVLGLSFFISGATANSYFYDFFYGGNPSNYKSYAWGLNDACPGGERLFGGFYGDNLLPFAGSIGHADVSTPGPPYLGDSDADNDSIRRFRRAVVVITYAETAPGTYFEEIIDSFQIGVDRILTRTTY